MNSRSLSDNSEGSSKLASDSSDFLIGVDFRDRAGDSLIRFLFLGVLTGLGG